ncbi:MAG: dihydrolipoamide acetyltransferase [Alphaproteobacteria bacterium]|nr:dihydrolipoamide acetyltransferase [Alphaproteobacteria bacterium]
MLPLVAALYALPAHAQDPAGDSAASVANEQDYAKELRTVEEEVNGLKERVFRSKATLQLLKELVVEGASSGARIVVWHLNQLGKGYAMESVQYFLDGKNIYTKVDPGGQLAAVKEMKVHEQSVPPGTHSLEVKMVLRGAGYGVFSYLRTYQFNVQSSYAVKVSDGRASVVRVIADSRGGLRNFVDRPTVRYEERSDTLREE